MNRLTKIGICAAATLLVGSVALGPIPAGAQTVERVVIHKTTASHYHIHSYRSDVYVNQHPTLQERSWHESLPYGARHPWARYHHRAGYHTYSSTTIINR